MNEHWDRRGFLGKSLAATSLAALASFEEGALLAQQGTNPPAPAQKKGSLPTGKLGKLAVSRLICGGNLISGFAHARDLIYVSKLLEQYFTDAKVCETLALCEAQGINTAILRQDAHTLRILKRYRQEGGKLQWIAQVKIKQDDFSEIQQAIDNGAAGVYVHGGVGDDLVKDRQVAVLAKAVQQIKKQGAVAGIAGHTLAVVMGCEEAAVNPDFYMKTFNSQRYWSAGPMPRNDSVWEETPRKTLEYMQEVDRPWIAYKVLGAGAIHPREGFPYAYQNGADFLCVGMFDFQVEEDVQLARQALDKTRLRNRPWA